MVVGGYSNTPSRTQPPLLPLLSESVCCIFLSERAHNVATRSVTAGGYSCLTRSCADFVFGEWLLLSLNVD